MAALTAIGLAASPLAAHAAPAPRAVIEMGSISVVLVASDKNINVYVDDIASNAPVNDASLGLELRNGGSQLNLRQVSPGLFVAPFIPSGRDRLQVTLSRAGAPRSEAVAELVQPGASVDLPVEAHASPDHSQMAWLLAGAMMSAALAILLGTRYRPAMRAWRPVRPTVG